MPGDTKLSTQEIVERVKAAFAPHHCEVNVQHKSRLWCAVFHRNETSHTQQFVIRELSAYRSASALDEILSQWRELLAASGYEFD